MRNSMHFGRRDRRWAAVLVTALATMMAAGVAMAAAPTTSLIEGVLTSSGGSAAADGNYDITFTIYDAKSGGAAIWAEGPTSVAVAGGRFTHALGSVKNLDTAKLLAAKGHWLALKVGNDPELPAQPVHASLFALVAGEALKLSCDGCVSGDQLANGSIAAAKLGVNYAGSATKGGPASDLSCTGCVTVAEMKFDGDVDLGGNALKAGDITGKTITATAFVGDGSKLTGIKTPAGECKNAGEVVKGINPDGTLKCVAALDPTALPKDGLNEISNDLLSNQFVDIIDGANDVAIPDNTGADANSVLNFPDIGVSQTFELTVEIANTDLSTVGLTVLPPDDKKTGWVLCDPCGDKDAKSYTKTFDKDNLPKSGDLAKWIDANPKGTWNLKVLDTSFCIPQAPGNSALCNVNNKTDGKIVAWSIKIQTLSNKKISIKGDTYQAGTANLKDVDIAGTLTVNGTKFNSLAKPATYRWAYFNTYMEAAEGWMHGNSGFYFGGVAPSTWTDGNATVQNLTSNKDQLRTLFVNKGYASGFNALLQSQVYYMYSSTNGPVYLSLWRVKNTTDKDITWPVYWTYTAYTGWGENASIGLNGKNVWNSPCNSQSVCNASVNITIPKSRTSTVIFQSTGSHPYSWGYNIQIRKNFQGFYNNCLKLPAGLEFIDDFDTAQGGWEE